LGHTGLVSTPSATLPTLLVAAPAPEAAPPTRQAMLRSAGLTETERGSIERTLAHWRDRAASGEGSAEALACVDEAAGAGPFTP